MASRKGCISLVVFAKALFVLRAKEGILTAREKARPLESDLDDKYLPRSGSLLRDVDGGYDLPRRLSLLPRRNECGLSC